MTDGMHAVSAGEVKDGTYFFIIHLAERKRTIPVDHRDVLRMVIQGVMAVHAFLIDAVLILPVHSHAIWTLPEGDGGLSRAMGTHELPS